MDLHRVSSSADRIPVNKDMAARPPGSKASVRLLPDNRDSVLRLLVSKDLALRLPALDLRSPAAWADLRLDNKALVDLRRVNRSADRLPANKASARRLPERGLRSRWADPLRDNKDSADRLQADSRASGRRQANSNSAVHKVSVLRDSRALADPPLRNKASEPRPRALAEACPDPAERPCTCRLRAEAPCLPTPVGSRCG